MAAKQQQTFDAERRVAGGGVADTDAHPQSPGESLLQKRDRETTTPASMQRPRQQPRVDVGNLSPGTGRLAMEMMEGVEASVGQLQSPGSNDSPHGVRRRLTLKKHRSSAPDQEALPPVAFGSIAHADAQTVTSNRDDTVTAYALGQVSHPVTALVTTPFVARPALISAISAARITSPVAGGEVKALERLGTDLYRCTQADGAWDDISEAGIKHLPQGEAQLTTLRVRELKALREAGKQHAAASKVAPKTWSRPLPNFPASYGKSIYNSGTKQCIIHSRTCDEANH